MPPSSHWRTRACGTPMSTGSPRAGPGRVEPFWPPARLTGPDCLACRSAGSVTPTPRASRRWSTRPGAILTGQATTVLITGGQAGVLGRGRVAAYTQPGNEFVEPFGAFTAAHFGLVAQRHLARFPAAREGAAVIAATIRNTGSDNPDAIMYGRGPFTAEDVLNAEPVVDPFTLLDLCLASEGGAAIVVTTLDRARDLRHRPVVLLGAGME